MKQGNSSLIILIIILILGAGTAFYFLNSPKPESNIPTLATPEAQETISAGRYVEYSKENYEALKTQKHVLFFYANWCPTCRPADGEFQARESEIPEDLIVVRVNYNDSETDSDEEALASLYNITYQHTYVLIELGQEIKRWNGGGLDQLLSQLN